MFDLRYHVASLAAVFVALAVGILLGIAISGNLSETQEGLERSQIAKLNEELQRERGRSDVIGRRGAAAQSIVQEAYPLLLEDLLAGEEFAVLFLGPVQDDLESAIERTLEDAGAGNPVRVISIDTPVDAQKLDDTLRADESLAAYGENGDDFAELGGALAQELVNGGETPLWETLVSELVEERSGTSTPPADGVVVVRSWAETAEEESDAELRGTRTLVQGLLDGVAHAGVPAVGVESTGADESVIDAYRQAGLSSVDDVDTVAGRIALAFVLAGGQEGHYGVKDTASDGVAPPLESLPALPGE